MGRFTILVDAGYFLRKSIEILSSKSSTNRADLLMTDPDGLIQMLIAKSSQALGNTNLLRVYWYDGVGPSMTTDHKSILAIEGVNFRAGTINGKGEQKGVDSKIVTDLIELASNHAISDAMLVTGDGDLAIGIELAQRRGLRVAVMGLEDLTVGVYHSQSSDVTNIADRVVRISKIDIAPFLSFSVIKPKSKKLVAVVVTPTLPAAALDEENVSSSLVVVATASVVPLINSGHALIGSMPAVSVPVTSEVGKTGSNGGTKLDFQTSTAIEIAVDAFIKAKTPSFCAAVVSSTGSIERLVDGKLLVSVMNAVDGIFLDNERKNHARAIFRKRAAAFPV
jgi:uncharacterized LabA/DUF88 family protein